MINLDNYWKSNSEEISLETKAVLNEYLLSIKLANKAEATIKKYRWVLERFLSECKIPMQELTSDDVLKWLNEFSDGKKPKTIDLFLSVLSSFFKFCLAGEYKDQLVIKKRWRPKIPRSLSKYLNEQEYAKVKITSESFSLRDRAVVLFLFSSGCRKTELANLSINDVDLDRRTARVMGKGKTRQDDGNGPLFMGRYGPLRGQGIYYIIKKLGQEADLPQSLPPHSCRHTFATNMLERGADLQFISDELGHADLGTTQVYARIPNQQIVAQYRKYMGY